MWLVDVDMSLQRTHFLCSKRQFIWALFDRHLWASFWNFRPLCFEFSHALAQVSNLKRTLVVHFYEFSQPLREALPAPHTEVCHNFLFEAVSIFLLVRQQLQHINQIPADALRYCMRFEDLGLINNFTCLYNQEPVEFLPVVFSPQIAHHQLFRPFPKETHQM